MKIERISENQIKCTLSRSDLASHQIKISELAYGSDKTRELFQDMMDQAFEECGFDASDIPLMIEAIPVSMDCIILMITKVDDPDEVDTDFSGLSNLDGLLGEDIEDSEENQSDAFPESENIFSALPDSLERLFSFDDIETVIRLAHCVGKSFPGDSSLYYSHENGKYYLLLTNTGCKVSAFAHTCNAALEYGSKDPMGFARSAYISEHFDPVIKNRALSKLANV